MRPTLRIDRFDSLALASAKVRENGVGFVPVVDEEMHLVGIVSEATLGTAMANMAEATDPVESATVAIPTVRPYETGAEALRRCIDTGAGALIVVDDLDRVMGLIAPSDLWPRQRTVFKPSMIGGMATPFGVYLTTGVVRGGAHPLALVTTGMAMTLMLLVGLVAGSWVETRLGVAGLRATYASTIGSVVSGVLFLAVMRSVPLAGTHGAEHQVVNAIERDEMLVPEVVRRMPRVHPRCGTNIAAALTLFFGIAYTEWIPFPSLRVLIGLIAVMLFWRPLGSFLQRWFTTKPPSDRQLASGIKAGEELLERHALAPIALPSPWLRLWNSGLLHVMTGGMLMSLLSVPVLRWLGFDIALM